MWDSLKDESTRQENIDRMVPQIRNKIHQVSERQVYKLLYPLAYYDQTEVLEAIV